MKKIALFVDVDNLGLSGESFRDIFDDVNSAGRIVYGKIYGVIDRKHKEIIDLIVNRGYDMAPPMRIKKRGSKVFDNRLLVDIMEIVVANEKIDTIAVACAPADMVPLFSKLREYGISVMSLDNLDKESMFFVDDVILGSNEDDDDVVGELASKYSEEKKAAKTDKQEEAEIASEENEEEAQDEEIDDEEEFEDEEDENFEDTLERVKNIFSALNPSDFDSEDEEE